MNKPSGKTIIKDYLQSRYPEYILGGLIRSIEFIHEGEREFIGFRGDRDCREMAAIGMIEKKYGHELGYQGKNARLVYYRWRPPLRLDDFLPAALPQQQRIII